MRFVYSVTLNETEKGGCSPDIGSNNVDAFDHRPEDRCTDLGFPGETDSEE